MDGYCTKSVGCFGQYACYSDINSSSHEHKISIYLHQLQFSLSVSYSFQTIGLLSPWLFIPRYVILFVAVVDEIVSLISLSDLSLLMCRNATDF